MEANAECRHCTGVPKIHFSRNLIRHLMVIYALLFLSTGVYAQDYKQLYTLTKVDTKDANTVTKFEWNETTQQLEPVYYRLDFNNTEYGQGDTSVNLSWKKSDIGVYYLETSEDGVITVKYKTTPQLERINNSSNNSGTTLEGTFGGHFAEKGGAIYNSYTSNAILGDINADFIENYVQSNDSYGGAIGNFGTIGNITGNFIANRVLGVNDYAEGGAIYNYGTIGDIAGSFISNGVSSSSEGYGGAIVNALGTIGNITGDFINNVAFGSNEALGGAIDNDGTIGNITGNFIGNTAFSYGVDGVAYGGAIYNYDGTIEDITGDFIGNTVIGTYNAYGGAIYNEEGGTIENITSDFIGNSASANNWDAYAKGGAIFNHSGETIGDITGDFIGNFVKADSYETAGAMGGAIYNLWGTIGDITGDFIGNFAEGNSNYASWGDGGAIYNHSSIGNMTGDFIGNYVKADGSGTEGYGGAIYNDYGYIEGITGDFIGNYVEAGEAYGGAIFNNGGTIDNITGNFIGNYVKADGGGANAIGGAIFAEFYSGTGIINSSFIGNYAKADGQNTSATGGAIYAETPLFFIAKDNYTSVFKGNYTETNGERDDNAIYVSQSYHSINFLMKNGGKFVMADNIRGNEGGYGVNISGDNIDNTTFYMLNDMYGAFLSVGNTTLNTINDTVHNYALGSFTLANDIKMAVDVDLAKQEMDRFTATTYGEHQGNLIVSGMNLLSDAPQGRDTTEIYFAETGLKDNVLNATGELPDKYQTAYTPIYKYNVGYDNRNDGGYFVFNKAGLNPAVLSTPVANQAGSQSVVNETVKFAFQHMDLFSQLPYHQRISIINNNKYAISEGTPYYNSEFEVINRGFWIKPFTSFEKINISNAPDVNAITYGTLVGVDSDFNELKHGWYNVHSLYAGYNGSQLSYGGVDTSLNGGLLGLTETFYKGNFFTALTATAGANVGTSSTMYGNEDFTSLIGGLGSKSGYNFEFKNGKYILQPILFMNYSFVNTFDYTSASGVRIDSDPLHTFQINPQLKFVSNLKNGWQPYASVGFVWNVLNSSKVRADDVLLPKMTVDPYVEYGIGIQRNWKDRFTGYGQAMVRNGGRNGVALTFGFRYALGKKDDL